LDSFYISSIKIISFFFHGYTCQNLGDPFPSAFKTLTEKESTEALKTYQNKQLPLSATNPFWRAVYFMVRMNHNAFKTCLGGEGMLKGSRVRATPELKCVRRFQLPQKYVI